MFFFELPTFDRANELKFQQYSTSKKTGGSHQSSKNDILKILDYLYNFGLIGDSLYNNTFD